VSSTRDIQHVMQVSVGSAQAILPSNDQGHDYLKLIREAHERGVLNPTVILVDLLNHYLKTGLESIRPNCKLAQRLIQFAESIKASPDQFVSVDYLLSVAAMLNDKQARLEKGDGLLPLLNAFFSVYGLYRSHLNSETMATLNIVDAWQAYVHAELTACLGRAGAKSNQTLVKDYERLAILAASPLLASVSFSPSMVQRFLDDFSYGVEEVRDKAMNMLILFKEKIPSDLHFKVRDILFRMSWDKDIAKKRSVCLLQGAFYAYLLPEDRLTITNYLQACLLSSELRGAAIDALLGIVDYLPQEILKAMITISFNEIRSADNDTLLKKMLALRPQASKALADIINANLSRFMQERMIYLNHIQNNCWEWLTEEEQRQAFQVVWDYLRHCDDPTLRQLGLTKLSAIAHHWHPEKEEYWVFDELLHYLVHGSLEEQYQVSIILERLGSSMPFEKQALFVNQLQVCLAGENKSEYYFIRLSQVGVLAELHGAMMPNELSSFLQDTMMRLKGRDGDQEIAACKAIGQLAPILSKEKHQEVVDEFIHKLEQADWSHAIIGNRQGLLEACSQTLRILNPHLSKDMRQKTCMRLFEIACASHEEEAVEAVVDAIQPYLHAVDYHQHIAMLSRLQDHEGKIKDRDRLFSFIYLASSVEPSRSLLRRLPEVSLPPEMVECITERFVG
jgi:hypothetical protein